MDASMLIIGAGLLVGSIVLSFSVERLMRRLGVHPENPEERSGGIRDIASRIDRWRRSRETPDRSNRS
jgi:lipoate-protein ligase A